VRSGGSFRPKSQVFVVFGFPVANIHASLTIIRGIQAAGFKKKGKHHESADRTRF
jgi:hypothetical protein